MIFGRVSRTQRTSDVLQDTVRRMAPEARWSHFEAGWLAADAQGGPPATWLDENGKAWAVFGERMLRDASGPAGEAICLGNHDRVVLSESARGVVAMYDPNRLRIELATDPLNYFPLYYRLSGDVFEFASNILTLKGGGGTNPDYAGIAQFLLGNWCLNGRTILGGVRRLLPGQRLVFDLTTCELTVHETSTLWSGSADDRSAPTDEELWSALLDSVRTSDCSGSVAGLMLSAGWDSRVVLAALRETFADRVVTLSHGAVGHGELSLSRRLAKIAGTRHLEVSLDIDALGGPCDWMDLLTRVDSVLFPWWRLGSAKLKEAGCTVGFSGLLGEVLGGHYTVVGRGRANRAWEVFQRKILRSTHHHVSPAEGLRGVLAQDYRPRHLPFLKRDVAEAVDAQVKAALEQDIEAVICRYEARGIRDAGRIVEAYNTEYRALDYFCQQPLTLGRHLDVAVPLGSRRLVEAILAVPLARRIHNSLSKSLLRRFAPDYLALPLAASPFVSAGAPILVQEGGRVVRWVLDRLDRQAYKMTGGRTGAMRRHGWLDLETTVRDSNFLEGWRDSLTWDLVDRKAVDAYIEGIRSHRTRVSLARPVLKLVYLDRVFGG